MKRINWNLKIHRENARTEWKQNVADEREMVKTLCAFANDIQHVGGGQVICGLQEDTNQFGDVVAKIVGLDEKRVKELKNKVLSICHRQVEPPLTPVVEDYPLEKDPSRKILIFSVTSSQYAHRYTIRNEGTHYYVRVNDRTQAANGLLSRLLEQKKNWPPFLDQAHPDASIEHLDIYALREFLGKLVLPLPVEAYLEPDVRFRGDVLSLVTHPPGGSDLKVPRNFTLLLFGREPHIFFRGAYAILSIYQGIDKTAPRVQRFEIFGPIPQVIINLMDKFQLILGLEIDKTVDMMAGIQNRPQFSKNAVMEAIVNSFVHRDYHSDDPVRITVFTDRIEIINPGGLYNGIRIEQLQKEEAIFPSWRNPSLASFMVALEFAQNEGLGIPLIIKATREISLKPPLFESSSDWFKLVIPGFVPPAVEAVSDAASAGQNVKTAKNGEDGKDGKDGLILISIGGDSIESQVKESLDILGLTGAKIAVNFASRDYVEGAEKWETVALELKKKIQQVVDSTDFARFHLFYRGPVIFAPLLGALIAPAKQFLLYTYENGRYSYTYTIDRKFLKG
ncbi:MAG: putative DNA binding domain-containing protein [Acidobacteria bacterium]|nr:putative DNA binding domain-containing protein [Acidobacteriota bacterium]